MAISLAEICSGGFLAPMGFWAGFWAILLGHLIGNTLMALGGVIDSDYGIMSIVSVRPAFGIRGYNLAAANFSNNSIAILRDNGTGSFTLEDTCRSVRH